MGLYRRDLPPVLPAQRQSGLPLLRAEEEARPQVPGDRNPRRIDLVDEWPLARALQRLAHLSRLRGLAANGPGKLNLRAESSS